MRICVAVVVMLSVSGWGGAVAQAPVAAMGKVAGTVILGDTQRPARFAKVTLTPVKSGSNDAMASLGKKDDVSMGAALGALMGGMTMYASETDAQGQYELSDVPPGDYYVLANVPGYVSAVAVAGAGGGVGDLSGAPQVHVDVDRTVRGDVTLARGAVISGRVTYDDGSPVPGVVVQVKSTRKEAKKEDMDFSRTMMAAMSGGLKVAATDDRGEYRVAGLPAGEYEVFAVVPLTQNMSMRKGVFNLGAMMGVSKMTVYAPATLHAAEAQKIVVKNGDDRSDIDLLVNLTGTHTVSGHVESATDQHRVNSGTVVLEDVKDKDVKRNAAIGPDGSFTIEYVPSGSYTLKISDAADTVAAPSKKATGLLNFQQDKVVVSYDDQSLPEIVTDQDVAGIDVELKVSTKVRQQPDLDGIMGGLHTSQ